MPKKPHADFTPTLEGYSGQGAFRYWCQLALPLTYDDSLSYYELLAKVVNYLNNTIGDVSAMETNVGNLANAYVQLQSYVNTYFDDLDLTNEVRTVLDEMAEDGTLDALLSPIVETNLPGVVENQIDGAVSRQIDNVVANQLSVQLPGAVAEVAPDTITEWLVDNVDPVGSAVIVDSSLSIGGAAADAKITGDELRGFSDTIHDLMLLQGYTDINYTYTPGKFLHCTDGDLSNGPNGNVTDFIDVTYYKKITYNNIAVTNTNYTYGMSFFAADKTTVVSYHTGVRGASETSYVEETIDVPSNAVYARFTFWNETQLPQFAGQFFIHGVSNFDELPNELDRLSEEINIKTELINDTNFTWNAGYITGTGIIHSQSNLSQYYSQKISANTFSSIKIAVGNGIQVACAYYNKDNGAFVERDEWQTTDMEINNDYDVVVMMALVTSTGYVHPASELYQMLGIRIYNIDKFPNNNFNFNWSVGYINSSGNIDTRQQFNNYYSKLLTGFQSLHISCTSLRQYNISYFDKHTGAFIENTGWQTNEIWVDNQRDVIINIATQTAASTGGTVTLENLIKGFDFYIDGYQIQPWYKSKVAFIGDSITYGAYTDSDNIYYVIMNNIIGFDNVYADGVAGACISNTGNNSGTATAVVSRLSSVPSNRDLVIIFAGTNDWGHNSVLGTVDDTTDVSFCGAIAVCINTLQNANPDVRLMFISPLHRYGYSDGAYPNDTQQNGNGYTLKDYVDKMKEVCERYSVPVIDMFSDSGLNPRCTQIKNNYMPDGLHPNKAGHNILARRIITILNSI